MFKTILFSVLGGIGTLWAAANFVPFLNVHLSGEKLLIGGAILGILVALVKQFVSFLLTALFLAAAAALIIFLLQ